MADLLLCCHSVPLPDSSQLPAKSTCNIMQRVHQCQVLSHTPGSEGHPSDPPALTLWQISNLDFNFRKIIKKKKTFPQPAAQYAYWCTDQHRPWLWKQSKYVSSLTFLPLQTKEEFGRSIHLRHIPITWLDQCPLCSSAQQVSSCNLLWLCCLNAGVISCGFS